MQKKLIVRAGTAALFGVLVGLYNHRGYLKWNGLGRPAFLNYEGLRFDRFMAHPTPLLANIVGGVIVALIAAGLYELVVAGVSKLLRPAS
ncbi:hypothetical protein [Edaphobacter aggregans]|uniref:hypothetical protein n=1 Tax=Edaphobacter aggregans TaxID=570835 RepID=UPI000F748006|nr:hypothetical protein [Edaphobacter aggregans]